MQILNNRVVINIDCIKNKDKSELLLKKKVANKCKLK